MNKHVGKSFRKFLNCNDSGTHLLEQEAEILLLLEDRPINIFQAAFLFSVLGRFLPLI